jgi:hypothetical protein
MGYERNDNRYGYRGGYGADRDRYSDDRARSYGDYGSYGSSSSARDYRGDRFNDRGDAGRERGYDPQDRGFFDRAGDEVRSWFGDEEAERRRRQDERYDERNTDRGYGYGSNDPSVRSARSSGYSDRGNSWAFGGGVGAERRWDQGGGNDQHDPSYRSWRDRQMQQFDRDYEEYRREHQSKFDNEFHSWRTQRQGQRDLLGKVQEHQEVIGSDGQHIGTVDHVRGDRILLTKNDQAAGGHHHSIPCSWVQSVEDKVTVNKTADQAKQHWRDEQRNSDGGLFGGDRDNDRNTNLNRSFSGTY